MNRIPRASIGLALLSSAVPAQQLVSPYASTNTYTNGNYNMPWGNTYEVFFQQMDAGIRGPARSLKGFAFRPFQASIAAPVVYTQTIRIGTAAPNNGSLSLTFASNWKNGSVQTTVFQGQVAFAPFSPPTHSPAPPNHSVLFSTPYAYLGVEPLLWEVYISKFAGAVTQQYYESWWPTMSILGFTAGGFGVGCTITGGVWPLSSNGFFWTSWMSDGLYNAPANWPAVLMMGDESDFLAGSIPLPLGLGMVGSPGCFLHINANPSWTFAATTDITGSATLYFPYTVTAALCGMRFRTQWAVLDTVQKVRTSNGLDHAVPFDLVLKPWPQLQVYEFSFGPTPPVTGRVTRVGGIVTTWLL